MNGAKSAAALHSVRFFVSGLTLITCLLVLQAQFRLVLVVGESMRPTLRHGNLVVVDKRAYRQRDPQRGDLVVAWCHDELIVKRVVGLPGEELEVIDGILYVNRRPLVETHPLHIGSLNIGRGTLASGRFALLGDNRGLPEGQTVSAIVSKADMVGQIVCRVPVSG
jgi:signal peptidase I